MPRIEMGTEDPIDADPPPDNAPPPKLDDGLDADFDDFTRHGDVDIRVTRIVLNSRLTGGYDFDGKPGDEGLTGRRRTAKLRWTVRPLTRSLNH